MSGIQEIVERAELVRRRLERAKQLIEAGCVETAQGEDGPVYLCRSQTDPQKVYVVEKESCPCQDRFQWEGRKLCKHILARLILEGEISLKKIGKKPVLLAEEQEKETARRPQPLAGLRVHRHLQDYTQRGKARPAMLRDIRISEQLAYQLLQFFQRYRVDVEQLLKETSDGDLRLYLEAMHYGDCKDAERLEEALRQAVKRSDHQ